ncbi:hypothetical protein DFH06DRAFT_1330750 [Mycena polygramma]|nr:hypothetical protein DFH06DRAFT_1330750 [Mycena polygramma]
MSAPKTLMRMNWSVINETKAQVEEMKEVQPITHAAWLFPDTDSNERVWVRVPVVVGLEKVFSAGEMDADVWLSAGRGEMGAAMNYLANCIRVERFPPDEVSPLDHFYSIVVTSQRDTGSSVHPVNYLISSWLPDVERKWRGNVLVFKHGKRAGNPIISIAREDEAIVKAILKRSLLSMITKRGH